jgi:hypothetical protein
VTDQTIIVQTTTGAEIQQKDVKGAHVTITSPGARTIVAAEVVDTAPSPFQGAPPTIRTRYRASFRDIGGVVGGATYTLHIVLPDGREVTGRTTVPSASLGTTVPTLPDLDRDRDTLSLVWPSARGAAAYEVYIVATYVAFNLFADTAVAIPGKAENDNGNYAFWPGLTHRVLVSAVDANYYDYYRRTSDFFSGRGIINHLDGAIGVFGSIAPIASYTLKVRCSNSSGCFTDGQQFNKASP